MDPPGTKGVYVVVVVVVVFVSNHSPTKYYQPPSVAVPSACTLSPLPAPLRGAEQRSKELQQGKTWLLPSEDFHVTHGPFCQLLLEGQGKPYEEVPWILSELQEQVGVASTPSDLWEMLHTVTLLAKVVAETSTELTGSALKVRSWGIVGTYRVVAGGSSFIRNTSAF